MAAAVAVHGHGWSQSAAVRFRKVGHMVRFRRVWGTWWDIRTTLGSVLVAPLALHAQSLVVVLENLLFRIMVRALGQRRGVLQSRILTGREECTHAILCVFVVLVPSELPLDVLVGELVLVLMVDALEMFVVVLDPLAHLRLRQSNRVRRQRL